MNHENLWAPWRMAYLRELESKAKDAGWDATAPSDFFAHYWAHPEDDETNHVVHRDEQGLIVLNKYPYSNGHLLVALGDARPCLMDYEPEQRAAFWTLFEQAIELVHDTLHPQGVNSGINEGRAAGAGVPEHLHAHVVPRWGGDTNFITVVGQVRIIPDSLEVMAQQYRDQIATQRENA